MERKKKKWDNTSCYNRRQTHITREKNRVRKRSHIHKACIHRAESGRKNALIFTSAQRQGQLSLSLSLSLSRLLSGSLWRRSDSWMKLQCPICMRFWADINHEWQTLNHSTCVGSCVSEREGEQNSSLFPSTSPLACHGRFADQRHLSASLLCSVFPPNLSFCSKLYCNCFLSYFAAADFSMTVNPSLWASATRDLLNALTSAGSFTLTPPPFHPLFLKWKMTGMYLGERGGKGVTFQITAAAWQKMGCAGMQESGKLCLSSDQRHDPAEQTDDASRCNQAFLSDNEPACFVIQISTGSH